MAKATFFRMMKLRLLFGLFMIGLAKPLAQSLEGVVHLTFPLPKQKMLGIYLDARRYEYDPWLADVGATLVDQLEIEDLDLSTTADSLLDVHFSAQRKPRMEYYLSIRAYSGKGGTQYYFIDGFQKIFNGKDEDEIDLRLATRLDKKKPKGDKQKKKASKEDGKQSLRFRPAAAPSRVRGLPLFRLPDPVG